MDGSLVAARAAVPRYFKIAARRIEKGEKIIKCGMSIGVAVETIEAADLGGAEGLRDILGAAFEQVELETVGSMAIFAATMRQDS